MSPLFVSAVDNGNLVASFWTLEEGCLDQLHKPLFSPALTEGLWDHLRILADLRAFPRKELASLEKETSGENWLQSPLELPAAAVAAVPAKGGAKSEPDVRWFGQEAAARLQNLREAVRMHAHGCFRSLPHCARIRR